MAKVNPKAVKSLGKHIDKLRNERGWSMREMADYCDIDKAQVNELTNDGIDFRYTILFSRRVPQSLFCSDPVLIRVIGVICVPLLLC